MEIHFQVPDIDKFNQAANKAPGVILKNMRLAMNAACRDIQRDARSDAREGGIHLFRSRTGKLEKSIDTKVTVDGNSGVEGTVFLDANVAPYGKYVHQGTKAHLISPKNKKSLRWASTVATNGKQISASMYGNLRTENYRSDRAVFVFRRGVVHHPGTKPDQFLYKAADKNRQRVNAVFSGYTDRAIKEAGL